MNSLANMIKIVCIGVAIFSTIGIFNMVHIKSSYLAKNGNKMNKRCLFTSKQLIAMVNVSLSCLSEIHTKMNVGLPSFVRPFSPSLHYNSGLKGERFTGNG